MGKITIHASVRYSGMFDIAVNSVPVRLLEEYLRLKELKVRSIGMCTDVLPKIKMFLLGRNTDLPNYLYV
jgi:hypothetical protein